MNHCFKWLLIIISALLYSFTAQGNTITLSDFSGGSLGKYVYYFQEQEQQLSVNQAIARFQSPVSQGKSDSIALGIGTNPVWLKFSIDNDLLLADDYRLAVETPWLDYIDTWLLVNGELVRHVKGGDSVPFDQRPMPYRFYAFEHTFPPGTTQVYMRVETLAPMAIPIRFSQVNDAISRDISSSYQYGFLYGIMMSLALYNFILFLLIRQKEYGLYSLYLIGFVLNSLSYTGQLHTMITDNYGVYFQDWTDIFLMITYSVAGLHFAKTLLDTKAYAPKLDKFVTWITIVIPSGMVIGFILNQLVFSVTLAFILNCGFVTLFVAMGGYALKANKPFAMIFLFSSVTAAICITISTLAVAGVLIPYNDYTFKAIEVGMAFEAVLLAVILARQFRMAKLDKLVAQKFARTDMLTQLNNRRGFQEVIQPIWQSVIREQRDASVVLIDLDYFKKINDEYGHDVGDVALVEIAKCINHTARKGDISARWGGEEFILFLPETNCLQAQFQAERLRKAISKTTIIAGRHTITLTASFGVAGSQNHQLFDMALGDLPLEALINNADRALYSAKGSGKNKVHVLEAMAGSS